MANKLPSNDIARLETIVILDYLLKKTDENHLATQVDINKYANDVFNIDIKRQRISDCLEMLYFISEDYPDLLQFKIERVSTGKRYKYYAKDRILNSYDVQSIVSAIEKDIKLTRKETDEIKNKIINNFSPFNNFSSFVETSKLSEQHKKLYNKIKEIQTKSYCMEFSVKDMSKVLATNSYSYSYFFDEKTTFNGYVYKIYEIGSQDVALIIVPLLKDLIQVPINCISILNIKNFGKVDFDSMVTLGENYHTIEEYLEKNRLPYGGNETKIIFSFNPNSEKMIANSFQKMFDKKLEYSTEGNVLCASIIEQVQFFYKWVETFNLEDIIEIIEPYEVKKHYWDKYKYKLIDMLQSSNKKEYAFELEKVLNNVEPIDERNFRLGKRLEKLNLDQIIKNTLEEMCYEYNSLIFKKQDINQIESLFFKSLETVLNQNVKVNSQRKEICSIATINDFNIIIAKSIFLKDHKVKSFESNTRPFNVYNLIYKIHKVRRERFNNRKLLILTMDRNNSNYFYQIFNSRLCDIKINRELQLQINDEEIKVKCLVNKTLEKNNLALIALKID